MSRRLSRRDVSRAVAAALIADPSQAPTLVRQLAAYLVDHRQTAVADLYINDIAHELEQQAGVVNVELVSARKLAAGIKTAIGTMLQQRTAAATVVLHETTDQALLGGFVARTADAEIDASVRTRLRKLTALTS